MALGRLIGALNAVFETGSTGASFALVSDGSADSGMLHCLKHTKYCRLYRSFGRLSRLKMEILLFIYGTGPAYCGPKCRF